MHDVEIPDPTWEQVEVAIRAADNDARNDLYLHSTRGDAETYLGVCGGSGRYLVTGFPNATLPTLVDAGRPPHPRSSGWQAARLAIEVPREGPRGLHADGGGSWRAWGPPFSRPGPVSGPSEAVRRSEFQWFLMKNFN